jgi:hypothetical protein
MSATFASTAQAESYAPPDAPYDASTCGFLVIDVTPAAGSIPANLPFIELAPYTLGEDIARTAELIRRDTTEAPRAWCRARRWADLRLRRSRLP